MYGAAPWLARETLPKFRQNDGRSRDAEPCRGRKPGVTNCVYKEKRMGPRANPLPSRMKIGDIRQSESTRFSLWRFYETAL